MQIYGIAVKTAKRGAMQEVERVNVIEAEGLEGNYRKILASTKRQVTIISLVQWHEACGEINTLLPWHSRRAQICIDGYRFGPSDIGKKIRFKNGVILEITGETKPCSRMDEIHQGLRLALKFDYRGGVTCRVIEGGTLYRNEFCYIE